MKYQRMIINAFITFILVLTPMVLIGVMPAAASSAALMVDGVEVEQDADGNYILTNAGPVKLISANGTLEGTIIVNGAYELASDIEISCIVVETGSLNTNDYDVTADAWYWGYFDDGGEVITGDLGESVIDVNIFAVRGPGVDVDAKKADITCNQLYERSNKVKKEFKNVKPKKNGNIWGYIEGLNLEIEDMILLADTYFKHDITIKNFNDNGKQKKAITPTVTIDNDGVPIVIS